MGPGDKIYTHKNSRATIRFKDGNSLNLSPLSLIEVSKFGDQNTLLIQSGGVTASLKEGGFPLTLILGKKKVSFTGKDSKIKVEKDLGLTKVTILRGQVKVAKKTLEASTFSLTEETEIETIKVKKLPYEIRTYWGERTQFITGEKLGLSWQRVAAPKGDPLLFIKNLSTQTSLKRQVKQQKVAFIPKESGHYQIWLESNEGQKSAIFDFKIKLLPLSKVSLSREYAPLYEGAQQELPLEIKNLSYPLELDILKESVIFTTETIHPPKKPLQNTLVKIPLPTPMKAGTYTIKTHPLGLTDQRFENITSIEVLEAPKLLPPKPFKSAKEIHFFGPGPHNLEVKWMAQNIPYRKGQEEDYIVSFVGQEMRTKESTIALSLKAPGIKTFKIRARQGPFLSPWTEDISIKAVFHKAIEKFPQDGLVIELEKPQQQVHFSWQKLLRSQQKGYQLSISQDRNFKKDVLSLETKKNHAKITLPTAGIYYWLVKYRNKEGELKLGKPTKIKIKAAPPPRPLKLKERQDIKLKRLKTSFLPGHLPLFFSLLRALIPQSYAIQERFEADISWPKERLAKRYHLQIFKKNKNKPVVDIEVESPQFKWKKAQPGHYIYRVAIIDYWNRRGEFSNKGELNLIAPLQQGPHFLKLLTPPHRSKISDEKIEFRFENHTQKKSILQFSSTLSFKKPLLDIPLGKMQEKVELHSRALFKKVQQKQLYWRIKQEQNKSKRRSLSFHLPPKRRGSVSRDLAFGQFEFIQRTSQTSYTQENPHATINANGFMALHLGLSWKGADLDIPTMINLEVARAKAFTENNYSQMKGQIFYEYYSTLFNRRLTGRIGIEYQRQTLFNEYPYASFSTLEANIFFLATDNQLDLSERSSLNLSLSGGQGLSYGLAYRHSLFRWSNIEVDLGLFYEGLHVTATTPQFDKEISRSNLGLSWFVVL